MATAAMVKQLREKTGARLLECSEALDSCNGDMTQAVDWLRKKNLDTGASSAAKPASEGALTYCISGGAVTVVEMTSSTDFVAQNPEFKELLNKACWIAHSMKLGSIESLAAQIVDIDNVKTTVGAMVQGLAGKTGENISIKAVVRMEGEVGCYVHHNGKEGAVVELEGVTGDLAQKIGKDLSMHVVFAKPAFLNRNEIPAPIINKERKMAEEKLATDPKNANKPDSIKVKIVEGQLGKFYAKSVIGDQPYYKDDKKTVDAVTKDLGVKIKNFVRFQVGVK